MSTTNHFAEVVAPTHSAATAAQVAFPYVVPIFVDPSHNGRPSGGPTQPPAGRPSRRSHRSLEDRGPAVESDGAAGTRRRRASDGFDPFKAPDATDEAPNGSKRHRSEHPEGGRLSAEDVATAANVAAETVVAGLRTELKSLTQTVQALEESKSGLTQDLKNLEVKCQAELSAAVERTKSLEERLKSAEETVQKHNQVVGLVDSLNKEIRAVRSMCDQHEGMLATRGPASAGPTGGAAFATAPAAAAAVDSAASAAPKPAGFSVATAKPPADAPKPFGGAAAKASNPFASKPAPAADAPAAEVSQEDETAAKPPAAAPTPNPFSSAAKPPASGNPFASKPAGTGAAPPAAGNPFAKSAGATGAGQNPFASKPAEGAGTEAAPPAAPSAPSNPFASKSASANPFASTGAKSQNPFGSSVAGSPPAPGNFGRKSVVGRQRRV